MSVFLGNLTVDDFESKLEVKFPEDLKEFQIGIEE